MENKEFYYIKESAWQSIIADTYTFGIIIGGLILNHVYLDKRWYIDIAFLFCFWASATAQSRIKKFTNKKQLIKYLQEEV